MFLFALSVSMLPITHLVIETGILASFKSYERLSKNPLKACFDALYGATRGSPSSPAADETTMRLPSLSDSL